MILLQSFILLLCLLGQAFFSGMETGVISINRVRLQHMLRNQIRGAKELDYFLRKPEILLGTTLVGTNLFMVITSVVAAELFTRLIGNSGSWVSSLVMTLLVLVFGEYIPKAWFQSNPARRARHWSPLLRFCGYIFYPIGQTAMLISKLFFRVSSSESSRADHIITKEELKHLSIEVERTGGLSLDERNMIHSIIELDRKTCSDIMTARSDMVTIAIDTPCEELLELAREEKYNRYPVYRGHTGNIVGIVNVFDVATDRRAAGRLVSDYMRPPQFIAAETPPDELLPRLRLSRQPLALVSDKKSRVTGLITIEDILEEIIGK